ncbi:MAG: GntR family transcriptional regulator [Acidobacteria bacterium]|nr:GntR family transcriptional regulator [Acidobacteriota bacterium]
MTDSHPTLHIDLASPVPVYRQIARGLRILLVEGNLAPGHRLPTIRDLAMDLGVHRNTVAEAYRLLADEGWIELRRRRGATVLDRPLPSPGPDAGDRWIRRLNELIAEALTQGLEPGFLAAALRRAAGSIENVIPDTRREQP